MTDISSGVAGPSATSSAGTWPEWLTRRRMMFASAATVVGGGIALNWGWLTAIGLAPILLSFAPCAAMCGLGLCMKGGSGKGCAKPTGSPSPD